MTRRWMNSSFVLAASAALVLLVACGGGETGGPSHAEAETGGGEQPAVLEIGPAAEQVLALADQADGEVDHVVKKCATCALAMDGSPDHAVQAGDYELHFCSSNCAKRFSENAEAAILALPQP